MTSDQTPLPPASGDQNGPAALAVRQPQEVTTPTPTDPRADLLVALEKLDAATTNPIWVSRFDRIELGRPGEWEGMQCSGECGVDHPPVYMWDRSSCEQCSGSDDYGRDFCPVGDFCCGC